jgi:hypothetical protein
MPTNLTGSEISATFDQLLHVNDGPAATEKTVYGGTGVATAMKIGTQSMSVGNVQLSGNTVQALSGNLTLGSNIAFSSAANARTALGLGSIATQAANNVAITGGAISGVSFSGSFTGITSITSQTLDGGNIRLTGNTVSSTNTNGDISITPNGTGEVNVTNIDVLSGKVPFNTITNRAYASFYDAGTSDQTGSTTDRTAVKWATASIVGAGITVASNSRITLAANGVYRFNASLQFNNSVNAAHTVFIWFAKNGTNIAGSAAKVTVPKSSEGGTYLMAYEIFETVSGNDYVEMYWYPSNTGVTLHYIAPVAASPGVTPAIPATPPAIVVVERIA